MLSDGWLWLSMLNFRLMMMMMMMMIDSSGWSWLIMANFWMMMLDSSGSHQQVLNNVLHLGWSDGDAFHPSISFSPIEIAILDLTLIFGQIHILNEIVFLVLHIENCTSIPHYSTTSSKKWLGFVPLFLGISSIHGIFQPYPCQDPGCPGLGSSKSAPPGTCWRLAVALNHDHASWNKLICIWIWLYM